MLGNRRAINSNILLKLEYYMKSLGAVIKKKISLRIFISIALTFCFFLILSAYEIRNNIIILANNINSECKAMGDYVISQALVPNQAAIDDKLAEFNQHNSYQIHWVNQETVLKNKYTVNYDSSWIYYYPLRSIGTNQFGYFIVNGSILKEKELY